MDALGLVELRMGKLHAATTEYDAAISNGAGASSYFGRAIAYERQGDDVHAQADRAKALDLDPGIEAKFAQYGLELQGGAVTTAANPAAAQRTN